MWRTLQERVESGIGRLVLAEEVWGWRPHARQAAFFGSSAQVRVAACGRRWGKTECLSLDVASLALTEAGCRQLIVAPTDVQARLLGGEVLRRLLMAFESGHPALEGKSLTVRQRPSLTVTVGTYPRAARDPSLLGKGEEPTTLLRGVLPQREDEENCMKWPEWLRYRKKPILSETAPVQGVALLGALSPLAFAEESLPGARGT